MLDLFDRTWDNKSTERWHKIAEKAPVGLESVYESLLQTIEEEARNKILTLLSIMIAAFRPLTIVELEIACQTFKEVEKRKATSHLNLLDYEDLEGVWETPGAVHDPGAFSTWLMETCGFIIRISEGKVFLAHQTVILIAPGARRCTPCCRARGGRALRMSLGCPATRSRR